MRQAHHINIMKVWKKQRLRPNMMSAVRASRLASILPLNLIQSLTVVVIEHGGGR